MKNLATALFATCVLVSCSTVKSSKVGSAQPNISNTSWELADAVKGTKPTIKIDNGKISGNAGCNKYFGELSLDTTAGNFMVSNAGATKMMCANMDVEDNFLKMLNQADKYVVSGNTLELYKGKLLLMKLNKK